MSIFGYNTATRLKNLDNFPNGWTGKELIELAEDLKNAGMTINIEGYTGYAPYVHICSGSACQLQTAFDSFSAPITTGITTTGAVFYT